MQRWENVVYSCWIHTIRRSNDLDEIVLYQRSVLQ